MNFDYDIEPPNHAQRWRGYVTTDQTDAEALSQCIVMSEAVDAKDDYTLVCVSGEKVFYFDYPHALMPGHIYSEAGMDEFYISKACEYHFDSWFKEDDD